jgi:hypothetical protein
VLYGSRSLPQLSLALCYFFSTRISGNACVVAVEQNVFFVYLSPYRAKVEDTAVLPLSSNKFGGGTPPRKEVDGGLPARRKCACRSLFCTALRLFSQLHASRKHVHSLSMLLCCPVGRFTARYVNACVLQDSN